MDRQPLVGSWRQLDENAVQAGGIQIMQNSIELCGVAPHVSRHDAANHAREVNLLFSKVYPAEAQSLMGQFVDSAARIALDALDPRPGRIVPTDQAWRAQRLIVACRC